MGGGVAFDLGKLSRADAVFGVASFLVFISMFFPWYTVSFDGASGSGSGFNAGSWRWLIVLLAFAGMAYVILKALGMLPKLPLPNWQVMGVIGGATVVLTLIAFIAKPGSGGGLLGDVVHVGWGFGLFFCLIMALAMAGGAYWDKSGAPSIK
jgi:hypothetical protein